MRKAAYWTVVALAVGSGLSSARSQNSDLRPVRPLDGRTVTVAAPNAQNRTPGTVVRVLRGDQVVKTMTTAIPVKLPASTVERIGANYRLKLASTQTFVLDPDNGEWFILRDKQPGYTLSVEGDNRLLATADGCSKPAERNVYLGTTSTKNTATTDNEYGAKREVLFVADCIPYRAILECDGNNQCDRLKKAHLPPTFVSRLVTLGQLDIAEEAAPRSLFASPLETRVAPNSRPPGSAAEFRYHSPGLTLVRQYEAPSGCDELEGVERTVDRKTPYSRLVFAGPDMVKRFPIALPQNRSAVANSQIFAPGGSFLVTDENGGRQIIKEDDGTYRVGKVKCRNKFNFDGSMGRFDDADVEDIRNFSMPWADTFCEWRGNSYSQPLCAAIGAPAMEGPHYGVDVRAWNTRMDADVPIVSASDGVVVEVDSKPSKNPEHTWEGYVVKIRSQHLIFVYRHMNPDKSPFRHSADNPTPIEVGDRVAAGQPIGYMGRFLDTPTGTTKHLHFEIEAPIPRSVLLGPGCGSVVRGNKVRVCTSREKAPPYATLVVSYLAERYGETVDLTKIDALTGLPTLPALPLHEIGVSNQRVSQR